MLQFDGQVALITGAASRIGKQIAIRLASAGGIPVIADLNFQAAAATAQTLEADGHRAFAVAMDVADEASVNKAVADTLAKYHRIDLLGQQCGPIPETCSRRCALTLALHRAYKRGIDVPVTLLGKDVASFQVQRREQRRQRYQEIIDGMVTGILPQRR